MPHSCFRNKVFNTYPGFPRSRFKDNEKAFNIFPSYTRLNILEMKYELLMYRGLSPDMKLPSSEFFFMFSKLRKDAREKQLDPFPFKQTGITT